MENRIDPAVIETDLCIIGGGPSGTLLAYLALKNGFKVVLVEIAKELKRSFRGEGITPGGVNILQEVGIFDKLNPEQYRMIEGMRLVENNKLIFEAGFDILKNKVKYGIDIPQPTLLYTILGECEKYENFHYLNGTKAKEILRNAEGEVTGVRLGNSSKTEVKSRLVVGSDGRYSSTLKMANFDQTIKQYKRDVIWFKLSKTDAYKGGWYTNIRIINETHLIILPAYPDLLRVGMYLPKGGYGKLKADGLEAFYKRVDALEPRFSELVRKEITDFKDISLLDIFSSKVANWAQDGIVLIGDAAHTCSPILGQGVNLALRDSYELAHELVPLLNKANDTNSVVKAADLQTFIKRRKSDIAFIQAFQDRNEKLLSYGAPMSAAFRRMSYRLLNVLPTKPFILSKVAEGTPRNVNKPMIRKSA